ncbi:MAG: EF-hand domain-containing protein [Hyphomicrobiaceae bacterium]
MTQDEFDTRTRERFARLDKNSDGVIDTTEIEASLSNRAGRADRRRGAGLDRLLARFDANRDGKVSKDEFLDPVKKRFARMDLNNDGKITDDDLSPMMRGRDVLKGEGGYMQRSGFRGRMHGLRRLIAADANKDGVITLDEVVASATQRFDRLDRSKDGAIDNSDFEAIRKDMMAYNVQRFLHRYGADKDGKVTREQFANAAKQRFAQRDLNRDGRIDRKDFRRDRDGRRGMGRHRPGGQDAPAAPGENSGPGGPAQKQ